MSTIDIITLGVLAAWMALAVLLPWLRPHHRPRGFWALVATGVPVLGWLTLNWGPMAGVSGFVVGLAVLLRPQRREDRGRALPPMD